MSPVEAVDGPVTMARDLRLPRWTPRLAAEPVLVVALPPMLVNILDSLCEGKTNKEIGRDWGISENTVKTHLKRLFAKIGAADRAHAVALALSGTVDVRIKGPLPVEAPEVTFGPLGATLSDRGPYPPRL